MPYSTNLPREIEELKHKYIIVCINHKTNKKIIIGNDEGYNWSYDKALTELKNYKNGFIARMINLKQSPYFVIDIDDPNITLEQLYKEMPILEETCCVKGTRKGFHFYFQNSELANLTKTTKCLKCEGDIITNYILEKDNNTFNHNVIYEVPTDEIKALFINEEKWNKFIKKEVKQQTPTQFNNNANTLNGLLNDYYKINANWKCQKIGDNEYQIICDNNMCLVDKKTIHSTENHSCLYVTKKGVNENCFSHGNHKNKEIEKSLKSILNIEDELFISIKDLEQGSYNICETIYKTISRVLKYCNSIWIVFNNKTGLWSIIKEPSYCIQQIIRKYIDGSIKFYMNKIDTIEDEKEQEALRTKIKLYTEWYKKSSGKGFIAECRDIFKTTLIDNDFNKKLDCNIYKLAFKNGVLDLKTLEFRTGIKYDDYITETLPYDYSKQRNTENEQYVLKQLKKIYNYNDSHLNYYLSTLGHALTGDAEKQKAIYFLVGQKGNNGKTLFLDVLKDIMPTYCVKTDSKILVEGFAKKHKYLVALKGKRIAWFEEWDDKAKIDIKMLKEIADGKHITNEVMYGTQELINLLCKMYGISNHTLNMNADGGVSNRYRQIQHNSHFSLDYEDDPKKLQFKMNSDLADEFRYKYYMDIINILIDYSNKYCKNGLEEMPNEFKIATQETLEVNNKFQEWFDDNCEIGENYKTSKKQMVERLPKKDFKAIKDEMIRLGYKYNSQQQIIIDGKRHKGGWSGFKIKEDDNNEI
jgi:phage/plasmid-associated DNA primase